MIRFTEKLSERELARFLFPLMLSSIFQQLYAPVGAAAAGRFLNQEAVAVIGACSAWDLILDALFISMTTGFAISINRAAGMGKEKRLRETVQGAVLLSAVMTAGSFLLAVFPDPFMVLANIPPQMREESREYLRFLLLGGGFQGLQNLLICLIQGSGESRFPAIVTVGAVIAQTGLSLVLLGQLHMGVEGVSLAVLFSQMGSVLLLSAHYLKGRWGIPLLIPFKGGNPLIWRGLAASGMAKVLMTFLANAGAFVLQREINRFPVDTIRLHLRQFPDEPVYAASQRLRHCGEYHVGPKCGEGRLGNGGCLQPANDGPQHGLVRILRGSGSRCGSGSHGADRGRRSLRPAS